MITIETLKQYADAAKRMREAQLNFQSCNSPVYRDKMREAEKIFDQLTAKMYPKPKQAEPPTLL